MGLTDIKQELRKLDKEKVISLVSELYKNNQSVKEYVDFYINPKENELFDKYRNKVFEAFYPKRGYDFKLKEGKKAISEFKKLRPSSLLIADLMLFYVETGVKFTNEFGDISESFYSSLETTYGAALKLMEKENLLVELKDRAEEIVNDTCNIGWGFHDYLGQVYSSFYED